MFLVQPSAREGPERHTHGSTYPTCTMGTVPSSPTTLTENMMMWCGRAFTWHQQTQTLLVHMSVHGTNVCSMFAGTRHCPIKKQTPTGTQDRGRNKGLPWPEEGPGTSIRSTVAQPQALIPSHPSAWPPQLSNNRGPGNTLS